MSKKYKIVIDTDSYAGNFEREATAYATGMIGECEVGQCNAAIFVEEEGQALHDMMDGCVDQEPDDHGCYRPTAIHTDIHNKRYNSFVIYFGGCPPTLEVIDIIRRRVKVYSRMDDNFNITGFRLIESETIHTTTNL